MLRAYKYRIYPTDEQKQKLAKTFGCCRYVYNWALELKEKEYWQNGEHISEFDMKSRSIHELREIAPWLTEVDSKAIEFTVSDLYAGYKNFFEKRAKRPVKRRKRDRQHYHTRGSIKVNFRQGLLSIPGIKNIPCVYHRRFCTAGIAIKQAGIELLPSGVYRASILVDDKKPLPAKAPIDPDKTIGIDTGLKHFAVLSDGQVYEPANEAKKQKRRLKLLSRRLAKKEYGSRQFRILKHRIARLHENVSNRRIDHIHKLTHYLACENQATTICVEDLNMNGMVKNKHLAYNLADAGIGEFYRQLEYKCQWAGKNYIKIDRFAPSSKRCSHCGHIYRGLKLSEREWTCPVCGTRHDRDLNAAMNIKHFGLSENETLPSVRRKVKPAEQPLVDDRSHTSVSEPKKPCRCGSTRRDREDNQRPSLRNCPTCSGGRSRKSEGQRRSNGVSDVPMPEFSQPIPNRTPSPSETSGL